MTSHAPTLAGLVLPAMLTIMTIGLWASGKVPEFLASLLFFTLAIILRAAPPEIVLSGLMSSAFWLVLSGFLLGAAIRKVGLADRIGRLLASRLSGSWLHLVAGVTLLVYGLSFVMPSNMGRITLLMPIILALADQVGLGEGRRGRIGLVLAVGIGTYELSASILPANVPNLVMAGAAESGFGIHFAYLPYLLLHAPILGVLKGVIMVGLIAVMYRDTPTAIRHEEAPLPLSAAEKRLGIILFVTLIFWMTDTLHGIQPAWVGLAAACICLLPRVGFLTGDDFAAGVNIRTCFYVAGILGLAAFVSYTGLGDVLGRAILAVLPLSPAHPAVDFVSLVGLTTALNFLITANGVPALFTPLSGILAAGTGMPLVTVMMTQVIGYATPLLPYQSAPIIVAMGLGKVPARDGLKLCLALAAVTFVVLLPLDYYWFRLLGWITQ